ncbi:hypothetical protein HCG51_33905 (plasmid) [Tolypothrix sp. PCC 7910]|uniref:hypothetical protein n=1 Tax=Tolypothrix sp. PCC 7910 TaxID=2099387 RepID=UPI0014277BC9|nr:hypothetical protein [Tolypothrix sp. PCC 7910]QIR41707.1 hypothetical protein HCG51_33905 [Tolypothrix sp. PCC 7910]
MRYSGFDKNRFEATVTLTLVQRSDRPLPKRTEIDYAAVRDVYDGLCLRILSQW